MKSKYKELSSNPNKGRKYLTGGSKQLSWRMPEKLLKRLEKEAKDKGWGVSDTAKYILDDYFTWVDRKD